MSKWNKGFSPATPFYPPELNTMDVQGQGYDLFVLQRCKELLTELWLESRITLEAKVEGEGSLAAAMHAVENPNARGIGQAQGRLLAFEQWEREQERNKEPF